MNYFERNRMVISVTKSSLVFMTNDNVDDKEFFMHDPGTIDKLSVVENG